MDPNATLAEILCAMREFDRASDNDMRAVAGARLATAVESLNEWLCRGGFLPAAWCLTSARKP